MWTKPIAPLRPWTKVLCLVPLLSLTWAPQAATFRSSEQVGEIVSRPSVRSPETALSAIQNARENVKERLAAIAAQADPLAEAVVAYKKAPSAQTAIQLLHREAVVAGIGATETQRIAAETDAVAKTCGDLAAQCLLQVEALTPASERAARAQSEYDAARVAGLSELRELHRSLSERGVTNEVMLSAAERRQISRLLQLYGSADLAERFLRMEANANQAALGKLKEMAGQFASRQRDFADLSAAYRLHAASFQAVGGSVGRVAHLMDVNQRFDAESRSAAEMQTELGQIDQVLAKTFDSLPDDLSPVFATPASAENKPAQTGLWTRLLHLLGMGGENNDKPVITTDNP